MPDTPKVELSTDLKIAFEHDFVRIEQQSRAAHMFFQAGMYDAALEWLVEVVNIARGLSAAMKPCDHRWGVNDRGQLFCRNFCTPAQMR